MQGAGAGSRADKKIYVAGADKPYLVGAGKIPLEPVPGSRAFLEPEPVRDIYKNGSKKPAAGSQSTDYTYMGYPLSIVKIIHGLPIIHS